VVELNKRIHIFYGKKTFFHLHVGLTEVFIAGGVVPMVVAPVPSVSVVSVNCPCEPKLIIIQ
jgi:hypothetical protein